MKTINEYGNAKVEKVNRALNIIKDGGSFNGIVYAKAIKNGKHYLISVYINKSEICFGEIQKQDVELVKAEFLAEVSKINKGYTTSGKYIDETKVFGTEAWLYSGMNAE